jgi:hypothetical protein
MFARREAQDRRDLFCPSGARLSDPVEKAVWMLIPDPCCNSSLSIDVPLGAADVKLHSTTHA